jgi:uncharacterized protein involved in copper resistance
MPDCISLPTTGLDSSRITHMHYPPRETRTASERGRDPSVDAEIGMALPTFQRVGKRKREAAIIPGCHASV